MNSYFLSCLVFGAWAVAIAIGDCRARRVPNALVAIGLCAALAASLLHAGPARMGVAQACGAALVALAALMPFFVLGVMGAGDVKVFAVLGAWCGLHVLLNLWIVASLAAGAHAVAMLIAQRLRGHSARAHGVRLFAAGSRRGTPYAACRRGTPYAACLTVPAITWLVWLNCFVPPLAVGSAR